MKKTGSTNHARFTVSDIPRAEAFYDPLLRFMGYELAEKSEERLAWKMHSPAGNRQCVILSAASEEGRAGKHDRYSPASFHEERRCHEYAAPSVVRFWFLLGIRVLR